MSPPLDIPFEYWIEHVTFGLLYVMFRFSAMIFYGGVPGFATDRPYGVWCRGLITYLLYVGPFENVVRNDNGFVCKFNIMKNNFFIVFDFKDSAAGWDELKPSIINTVKDNIKIPPAHIGNLSFDTGIFPVELKIAKNCAYL